MSCILFSVARCPCMFQAMKNDVVGVYVKIIDPDQSNKLHISLS